MSRLPLGPIEAFVTVARAGSLTGAARTMHLTVPALSRRIQILEAHLGVRLFARRARGLDLTDAGRRYLAELAPAWDGVRDATDAARGDVRAGRVRLSVMPTFAANWLMPRLSRLHDRHPTIEIEIETSPDPVDLTARRDLDCAVRLGTGPWPGCTDRPFLPVDGFPVAAPTLFGVSTPPLSLDVLAARPLIATHHQPEFWREWFAATRIERDAAEARLRYRTYDNLQLVYEAAAAGMGVALGLLPVVLPYLADGRLIPLTPGAVRLSRRFHLVRRTGRNAPNAAFAAFRDWLFAEAASFAAEHPAPTPHGGSGIAVS